MPSTASANEHEAVPYKVEVAPAARRSLDRIHGHETRSFSVCVHDPDRPQSHCGSHRRLEQPLDHVCGAVL